VSAGHAAIGVDYGGTKALAVRLEDGRVTAERSAVASGPPSEGVPAAVAALWDGEVGAVGAGVAGLVDHREGRFLWGPHVSGPPVALRDLLEQRFGVPAAVANDVDCAALAELRSGALRDHAEALMVTVGTGIGGAFVSGGRVRSGAGGLAGEWGHLPYSDRGLPCSCGASGCWETEVSGPALARAAARHVAGEPGGTLADRLGSGPPTAEAVTAAAADGDREAAALVAGIGEHLGRGLARLITIFDPEVVVIGGGLGSAGEDLLGPARVAAARHVFGAGRREMPGILTAALGARAGAVGAAMAALDAS
jgi:glucokinase